MRAFIFLRIEPQHTMGVMHDLKGEPQITEANLIHGPYDCLIEVDGQTLDEVNQTVMRIREMSGVDDTVTCLVVQSWQRPDSE